MAGWSFIRKRTTGAYILEEGRMDLEQQIVKLLTDECGCFCLDDTGDRQRCAKVVTKFIERLLAKLDYVETEGYGWW